MRILQCLSWFSLNFLKQIFVWFEWNLTHMCSKCLKSEKFISCDIKNQSDSSKISIFQKTPHYMSSSISQNLQVIKENFCLIQSLRRCKCGHNILRLWYFTKFCFNLKWNGVWLLLTKMLFKSCWANCKAM